MKVKVIKDKCIGCGSCTAIAPDYFDFGDDGFAECIKEITTKDDELIVKEAMESCPTEAIEKTDE